MSQPNFDRPQIIGIDNSPWLRLRSVYSTHLAYIRKYKRSRTAPRCYISHLPEQIELAEKLNRDLQHAGIVVIDQATEVVEPNEFVIVLDTDAYRRAFQDHAPALNVDAHLIHERLSKNRVIALAVEGENKAHKFQKCIPGWFCDETHYLVGLFDLVLDLYRIPPTHANFAPMRQILHTQWEQTLAQFADQSKTQAPKIFISYARKDEPFKDDLIKMLAGMKRRGVIDTWDDRLIEPGEEWFPAIKQALNECDLALLLVSADFIASGFIYKEELPVFVDRRKQEGMTILSIIVRDCLWQSEPVLKDLQALPRDGKAVITFAEATGERDRAWTEIAKSIEKLAQSKSKP